MRAPLISAFFALAFAASAAEINWQPWSSSVFEQARRENKFVLLDLEAVWCHWCHVMDETTYRDPEVVALLQANYIPVKVDQDSRPDISNRYEDYGWPATVVFGAAGGEIVKRQGYIEPKAMSALLKAIVADPSPGPSVKVEPRLEFGASPRLTSGLRGELQRYFFSAYDSKRGGWGKDQKYLDWNCVEYAMLLARSGDKRAERMARRTLDQQLKLIDPVWGGVYQYSVGGDWDRPHFEKIMAFQTNDLRIYALAYRQWNDPAYLRAALSIAGYLRNFLTSPDGAFYTSQDADLIDGVHSGEYFKLDDAGRRAQGIPRIDQHRYARENGWAIAALAELYGVTHDRSFLDAALRAADWVAANRAIPGGGFRHDAEDPAGPYLDDTLSMGRAFLALFDVIGDAAWLNRAESAVLWCDENFRAPVAGFATARTAPGERFATVIERDENVEVAGVANALFAATADQTWRQMADRAMRYLVEPSIARETPTATVLLIERKLEQAKQ